MDRLRKKKREKTQITKILSRSGDIMTNLIEIKRIRREYTAELPTNEII